MIDDPCDPNPAVRRGREISKDRSVLYGDLLLIVVAVCNPGLNGRAIECACDQPLVEGMLVVIALPADGVQPCDEIAGRDGTPEVRLSERGSAR